MRSDSIQNTPLLCYTCCYRAFIIVKMELQKNKRRCKVCNCKYFKSTGRPFGGCKHPNAVNACLKYYIDECDMSERCYSVKSS